MEAVEVPTAEQEITRKSLDALDWLLRGHRDGKLTTEQMATGLDTLFMAVSGVVSEDVFKLITEASLEARRGVSCPAISRFFADKKSGATIIVEWIVGDDKVTVKKSLFGETMSAKVFEESSAAAARLMAEKTVNGLVVKGYAPL